MGISILKFLSVHHCVLQSKICVLTYSVTTITIAEWGIKTKNARVTGRLDLQKDTGNEAEFLTQGHREGQLTAKNGSNLPVHSWFNFGRHHFLWNVYIKTKGRLLKIFNSIKYLTLGYIMAKNMNYDIYKPQIIFHPLLSVLYYFFEFSHCFYFHTARIVLYYFVWKILMYR